PEEIAQVLWTFSLHKTLGMTMLGVSILRILWAIRGPKPALLNTENRLETFAAEITHWILYIAILLTPIAGWFRHAATEGFAKIWWPFGQDIFFIPKNERLSEFFASMHWILAILMATSILAHIGGALKHFVIDRDKTLQRMLPLIDTSGVVAKGEHSSAPKWAAFGLFGAIILTMGTLALNRPEAAQTELQVTSSEWIVAPESTLAISIKQLGADVSGQFDNWTADIRFDPDNLPDASVTVTVAMDSLSLGSVTDQAQSDGFLAASEFTTAIFTANDFTLIEDGSYIANGTLKLRGITAPLTLGFTLNINGNTAEMQGTTQIVRLDYGVGAKDMPDDSTLGFMVEVSVDLRATRS
ncbi:MAG: YceI family protein, partial [Alphaproteobacteria bacterium]